MIRRLLAVGVKEMLQLRRDWRTAATLLGMPVVLLMIYGYALSFDVENVRLAVVDRSGTQTSRRVVDAFLASAYFKREATVRDVEALDRMFETGRIQAALVLPHDLAASTAAGRPARIQMVLDGSDSQTATTILGYARQVVAAASAELAPVELRSPPPIEARSVVWYNPELESAIFLVPGLVAFILMVTSAIATALAVVREKERGTMESLRATPLRALDLLLGKTAPYLLLASVSAAGSLFLAWLLFGVPVRGSLGWVAVITLLFLVGGLGWGVLISSVADTQQVAFQMSLLTTMLPTLLLSGFVFPISSMPEALQVITHIVPARYYIAALRGIVLKGAGPEAWAGDAVALAVYGAVVLSLATARTVRSL